MPGPVAYYAVSIGYMIDSPLLHAAQIEVSLKHPAEKFIALPVEQFLDISVLHFLCLFRCELILHSIKLLLGGDKYFRFCFVGIVFHLTGAFFGDLCFLTIHMYPREAPIFKANQLHLADLVG